MHTPSGPLAARKEAVTDRYHDTSVTEHYRWLEGSDAEVTAWVTAQDRHARGHIDGLPQLEAVTAEVAAVLKEERATVGGVVWRGGTLFARRHTPPDQHAKLVVLPSLTEPERARTLVDPDALDPQHLTGIDFYEPSADGRRVAVSMSRAGTEMGDLHVVDVATGQFTGTVIPRVHGGTGGGAVAWKPDGSGFYYTRYPREGERPAEDLDFYVHLWFHPMDGGEDVYVLGEDLPKIAELELAMHPNGTLLVTVQNGDGGEYAHWLVDDDGIRQLSAFGDRMVQATFDESGQHLYLLSRAGAPNGRLLKVPLATLADPVEVLPEGDDTLVDSFWSAPSILEHGGRLYVQVQTGGPSAVRVVDLDGTPLPPLPQPEVATVGGLTPLSDGQVLFRASTYTAPTAWFVHDPATGRTQPVPLSEPSRIDLSGVRVLREMATSADGTQVPVNILVPDGVEPDGTAACVLTAYGGYSISLSPGFRAFDKPLLDRGVVVAIANLRGGGEYGERWHLGGNLLNKQNVFDDFHAVIQHLVARGWCAADRVGITGGSNGGLLMGAAFTQHPGDAAAVVSAVGMYDMLRVERSPNGAFNITEFGTVEDEAQFGALHAYSPYHHVQDGADYPAILFTTGMNDPRVAPWHSFKMTARMQEAGAEVYLRVGMESGHGASNVDDAVQQRAEKLAFLLHHLGVE